MSTVNDLYIPITYDLLEDNGLVLGLLTVSQFIGFVNEVLSDWNQRTAMIAFVQTQLVQAGTSRYAFPDNQMRVDLAFLGGLLLEPTTVQGLNNGFRSWRTELALPTRWHADELPLKTIELAAVPNDTGVMVPGAAYPDPPYSQTGWNVLYNSVTYTPTQHMDLTLIGPQMPAVVGALTDPLCFGSVGSPTAYFPQDVVLGYVGFGVLARIFSADSELKDPARAAWAVSQYEEGIALMQAIMSEGDA
jgi:hypothetical protein